MFRARLTTLRNGAVHGLRHALLISVEAERTASSAEARHGIAPPSGGTVMATRTLTTLAIAGAVAAALSSPAPAAEETGKESGGTFAALA